MSDECVPGVANNFTSLGKKYQVAKASGGCGAFTAGELKDLPKFLKA